MARPKKVILEKHWHIDPNKVKTMDDLRALILFMLRPIPEDTNISSISHMVELK